MPANIIIRGQTFQGAINLKQDDGVDTANVQPFVIQNTDVIEVFFPAATTPTPPSVVLSSAVSGEVTIVNGPAGEFIYKGSPAKSLLLLVASNPSVDVRVTQLSGDVFYFEKQKAIKQIKDPDNLP